MNNESYRSHLDLLVAEWSEVLSENDYDSVLIAAGENSFYYADDQAPAFHPNPHLLRWIVDDKCEHCVLLLKIGEKPLVHWFSPPDYWYLPSSVPCWLDSNLECEVHSTTDQLHRACANSLEGCLRTAYVGPEPSSHLTHESVQSASARITDQLDFGRAYKTPFEIECMVAATSIGVKGHVAARGAFFAGASEFDIHAAYLSASRQSYHELPYPSIVGVNEHASTLHYQHYDIEPPSHSRSLLIDAGGKCNCYHSDITRTHSSETSGDFHALVRSVDKLQQQIVAELPTFQNFVELHVRTHQLVADALVEHSLVKCSPTSAYEQELTDIFYPHGTGHLLGLQTHDVGGHLVAKDGTKAEPQNRFPSLRLTRSIEPAMVFTVEPGIYFIPMLLERAAGHKDINWPVVEQYMPYGGVRIEDNVVVGSDQIRNLTREAFQREHS